MLFALATPGSAFKPSLHKVPNTWRLKKFKKMYIEKGGSQSTSRNSSLNYGSDAKEFLDY